MQKLAPFIFIGFLAGGFLASILLGWPTKHLLAHTPRLTARQFASQYREKKWIRWGYPAFTFVWFTVAAPLPFILLVATIASKLISLNNSRFEIMWAAALAFSSTYTNAVAALGTGVFEMLFQVSGTGAFANYFGLPIYNRGAKIDGTRVPFAYLAGEEVSEAGRIRVLLATTLLVGVVMAWLGVVWFANS